MTPGVSLVIVNFNAGEALLRCLEAVALQTLPPTRLILVDNASTDGSAKKASAFLDSHVALAGISESVRNTKNLGFAAANNAAIARCNTEFIALLNPDAIPQPDWLEKLVAAAKRHPQAASFGSLQMRDIAGGIIDGLGDVYHFSGASWRKHHGRKLHPPDLLEGEIFSPCAAAALYRRSAFLEVGGFDEDFFCYMEDVDLGFRLRLRGYAAVFVPQAIVEHASENRRRDFAVYHGHRNLVWVYLKNMPGIFFWIFLPLHLLINLQMVYVVTLRGQGEVVRRSKRDALLGIARVWDKRLAIQSQRKASLGAIWSVLDKSIPPEPWRRTFLRLKKQIRLRREGMT